MNRGKAWKKWMAALVCAAVVVTSADLSGLAAEEQSVTETIQEETEEKETESEERTEESKEWETSVGTEKADEISAEDECEQKNETGALGEAPSPTVVEESTKTEEEIAEGESAEISEVVASGTCGADGDNLIWELTSDGILTISGDGAMADYSYLRKPFSGLDISRLIFNGKITSIGAYAFRGCSGFSGNLEIPSSVTSIGAYAFDGCSGFSGNLEIPSSVTSIENHAFRECSGFSGSLTISLGVTSIGAYAFDGCSGFSGNLEIPSSVTSIGDYAFYGCSGFSGNLTIPSGVTSIGRSVFRECNGFSGSLTISSGVTSIGAYAFYGCSGFSGNLTIPLSVTSISDSAFYGCSGFSGNLTIPSGVTSISDSVFYGCSGFSGSLTIPSSVTSIENRAFWDCSGLSGSLIIPSSVTSIGDYAFRGCSGFSGSLTIPSSVTSIGAGAFNGCSGFSGNLTIPSSVTSIEKSTFAGCSGFSGSLTIPSSVTNIGYSAFYGCSGFSGSLTIPSRVTSIGESAFHECSGFSGSLIISSSVTSIGDYAFVSCSGFSGNLTIPSSVTSIGDHAFAKCSGFDGSLTIPSSVTSVGDYAFERCSGLETVHIFPSENEISLNRWQFKECISLKQLYLPANVICGSSYHINATSLETIYGVKGSSAEEFAKTYNIPFVEYDFPAPRGVMQFFVEVCDDDGNPLPGVEVFVGNSKSTTGADGKVKVSATGDTEEKIVLQKTGYKSLTVWTTFRRGKNHKISMEYDPNAISFNFPQISTNEVNLENTQDDVTWLNCNWSLEMDGKKFEKYIPVGVERDKEENTLEIVIGFPEKSDKGIVRKNYQKAKNLCKAVGESSSAKGQQKLDRLFKEYEIKKVKGTVGVELDVSLAGYVKIDCATNKLIEGGGVLAFSGEGTIKFRPVAPVASVFYAKLSVTLEATGKLKLVSDQHSGISFAASLELEPGFGIGIGAGGDLVYGEGGFEGNADVEFDFPWISAEDSFSFKLQGELYLEGGFFGFKYRKSYPFPDLEIWPRKEKGIAAQSYTVEESILSRDYLQNSMIRTLNADKDGATVVYPYADVQLGCFSDGSMLAVWINDNGTKTDENRTSLVYAVYKDGNWSRATEVYETGRGDFYPCLVTQGDKAYLAWANIRKAMKSGSTLEDFLKNTDISYSVYENGSFTTPVSVTAENTGLAKMNITVAVSSDREAIVWTENSENDLYGTSGSTAIYARERVNGKWQPSQCIQSGLAAVTGITAYYVNGELCTAYSAGKNAADTGCDVYLCYGGKIKRVTNDGKINRNLTVCDSNMYWLSDDEIMQMTGVDTASIKPVGVSCFGMFAVIENGKEKAIILNDMDGLGSELYLSKESDGQFGSAVPVTSFGGRISYFSAAYKDDGDVAAVFVEKEIQKSDEAIYGDSYLYMRDVLASDNISAEYLYVNNELAIPGATLPVTIGLENQSSFALEKVHVKLLANGKELYNEEIGCVLPAGEQGSIDVSVTLGAENGNLALEAEVLPVGFTDSDLSDNVLTETIGLSDIALLDLNVDETGTFTGKIKNEGYADSGAVTLSIVAGGQEGEEVYKAEYSGLAAGAETDINCKLPDEYLDFSENKMYEHIFVSCEAENAERLYHNNSDTLKVLPIAVTGIEGIPESLTLTEKESYMLTPQILPSNAHNKKVYYLSEDAEIVYVTDEGRIIASNAGEVWITALTSDGSFEAKCKVTVCENTSDTEYHISNTYVKLIQGGNTTLSVLDSEGNAVDSGLKWDSGDPEIAKVENGTVTALKQGVANIIVHKDSYYDICVIEIDADGISSLMFDDTQIVMDENETKQLSVHILPETITGASDITWSSSNEEAVTVSDDGIVTAVGNGNAIITAKAENGVSAECKIQVNGTVKYTVTFDSDFGENVTKFEDIPENGTVTLPNPPVRQGYSFLGWFTQRNGQGIAFDASTAVTQNVTVYAYWKLVAPEETVPVAEEGFVPETSEPKPVEIGDGTDDNNDDEEYEGVLPEDVPADGKIPDGLWIAKVPDVTYTGKAIKPEVHIYDSTTRLKEKKDYTISYKNNVNAYVVSGNTPEGMKAPTVTVTGKGNYSGKETAVFNILPVTLNDESADVLDITLAVGNKVQKPVPVIMVNGKKLANKKDFTLEYPDQSVDAYKGVGTYRIKAVGKGNYQGERIIPMTITDKKLMSKASVAKIKAQTYTGNPLMPKPVVKHGKDILAEGTGYELEYRDNTEIGIATVIVKGIGDYCGQTRVTFPITGGSISKAKVSDSFKMQIEYTGASVTQSCTLTALLGQQTVTLDEGTDYTVKYFDNTKAGKATVVYTGKGAFTGTLKKTYSITPYDIGADSQKKLKYDSSVISAYAKGGSRPVPTIIFGNKVLKAGTDFTISYKNNKAVSATGAQMIVKGMGNYKGSITIPFEITTQDLSNLTLTAADGVYQAGKANSYKTVLQLTDVDGKALAAGKDYNKETIEYVYVNAVNLENGVHRNAGDKVDPADVIPAETELKVTVYAKEGSNYTGSISAFYRIAKADLKNAKVTVEPQTYNGKQIKPGKDEIKVEMGKTTLLADDYDIVSYGTNIEKGAGTLTIKGKGSYGGIKTVSFKIKTKGFLWWNK